MEAFDLLTEARWEMEGVRRATLRYREAASVADPATLPSGQKLLREIVPALAARISQLQAEGMDRTSGGNPWGVPIQLLDAEILAVITLVRALHGAEMATELSHTGRLAKDITSAIQAEIGYRSWCEAQAGATKAKHAAGDWTHVDLWAVFKKRFPTADLRSWKRFMGRMEIAKMEPWAEGLCLQLGTTLLKALVEAAPDHFTMGFKPLGNHRMQSHLTMTDSTRAMLQDIEVRAEVARPMLLPMLMRPNAWTRQRTPSEKETPRCTTPTLEAT